MISAVLLLLQAQEELAAEVIELDALSWIFMLVSMGSVISLTAWCFYRVLSIGDKAKDAPVNGQSSGAPKPAEGGGR